MASKKCEYKARRPLRGYALFVKENYHEVAEANPDLTFGEVGQLLGEMWRKLTCEEKKEYA